jgi:hypothetical protein
MKFAKMVARFIGTEKGKIEVNDRVLITNKASSFFGRTGQVWSKENGTMWQIGFNNYGVCFSENEFVKESR